MKAAQLEPSGDGFERHVVIDAVLGKKVDDAIDIKGRRALDELLNNLLVGGHRALLPGRSSALHRSSNQQRRKSRAGAIHVRQSTAMTITAFQMAGPLKARRSRWADQSGWSSPNPDRSTMRGKVTQNGTGAQLRSARHAKEQLNQRTGLNQSRFYRRACCAVGERRTSWRITPISSGAAANISRSSSPFDRSNGGLP